MQVGGPNKELEYKGSLQGHGDWVTSISTPTESNSRIAVSGSRDRKVIVWDLATGESHDGPGVARKSLTRHGGVVSEVVVSNDGQYAISGCWDNTLRLWDLQSHTTLRLFKGHEKNVFSVAFSADNRQIVSGGLDRNIILWNTLAECKYKIESAHDVWCSCVRFSPAPKIMVSAGWDGKVCVWDLDTCQLRSKLTDHQGALSSVAVSPDGSLCASGGADGVAMLWDVNEGKHLYSLEAQQKIQTLCFSPCNYWLCSANTNSIIIWDLENKNVLIELHPEKPRKSTLPWCTSLCWTADGKTLLAGCSDGNIYVYEVKRGY